MTPTPDYVDDPAFIADLESELTGDQIAAKWGIHPTTARKWRRVNAAPKAEPEQPTEPPVIEELTGRATTTSEGGEFLDVQTSEPLVDADDWAEVFKRFNLDPAKFRIVDDTVRMSTWQQSKRLENGDRDTINLYSYRARFTRTLTGAISQVDWVDAKARIAKWKLPRRIPGSGLGAPVAAVVNLADMQLGKADGDGLTGTLQRLHDGLENTQAWIEKARKAGQNINEVVLVNNGDPYENIAGNYANQNHTVKGGLRLQQNHVLDVWEAYARIFYPQFEFGQFITMHCNHTQNGRSGGAKDSITGDEDTGSAFLGEVLQRILRGRPEFDHVRFTIPNAEMNVYADIAGVPVGFNHGHKIPGSADASSFEKWLNGQVRGDAKAHAARIWITAHKHHFASWDMGSTFVFQCPSCDGGSKWLTDSTGRYSRSGILALLIGEHDPLGWSDVAFL